MARETFGMTGIQIAFRAAVFAVCSVLGLAGIGCGGRESDGPNASIKTVPTGPPVLSPEARRAPVRSPRARPRDGTAAGPSRTSVERAFDVAAARLPIEKRNGIVLSVTRAVFSQYGFGLPEVTVSRSGRGVRAIVRQKEACTATRRTHGQLVAQVRRGVPWLRTVRIVVGSSGEQLSAFVREHCRPLTLPSGSGPVLLTRRGTGFATTATFEVRTPRWRVEYVNDGGHLYVIALKKDVPTGAAMRVVRRGTGRKTFFGAGSFKLQIAGAGEWVVRVRGAH